MPTGTANMTGPAEFRYLSRHLSGWRWEENSLTGYATQAIGESTRIQGLDFIILPTQDLVRAEDFYHGILGLPVEYREGDVAVEFDLGGGLVLALVDWSQVNKPFAPVTAGVVALRVGDVEAAFGRLQALGVTTDREVIDSSVCKMGYFFDPDGNRLMLHNRYAPV
jgi:catechol 2,3-dioxygenase-like lactoylglutathione lyase family enzyme